MFHVSQLKKCLRVPSEAVEIETIQLEPDLTYQEHPIKILDQKERVTRRKVIKSYKVQWSNHSEEGATWEKQKIICEFTTQSFPFSKSPLQCERFTTILCEPHHLFKRRFASIL